MTHRMMYSFIYKSNAEPVLTVFKIQNFRVILQKYWQIPLVVYPTRKCFWVLKLFHNNQTLGTHTTQFNTVLLQINHRQEPKLDSQMKTPIPNNWTLHSS